MRRPLQTVLSFSVAESLPLVYCNNCKWVVIKQLIPAVWNIVQPFYILYSTKFFDKDLQFVTHDSPSSQTIAHTRIFTHTHTQLVPGNIFPVGNELTCWKCINHFVTKLAQKTIKLYANNQRWTTPIIIEDGTKFKFKKTH